MRVVRVQAGDSRTIVQGCSTGERLIAGWNARAFYTPAPPRAELIASFTATERLRGGRVAVSARAGVELRGVRAVVQVGAVCAGGA